MGAHLRGLRLVHQRAADPDATAVVLLHGWPDSVLRYERVLPLLEDLHVVVPALPGYPFAAPSPDADLSSADMAEVVAAAMAELGYRRYVVSGGDIGRGVAMALAANHADRVAALHITDVPSAVGALRRPGHAVARGARPRERVLHWRATEGGYLMEQATKPHTLAVALGDSPAGLAAWIVEKLRSWSDCGGDVEAAFPREDLLTWITAYWVTGAIGTSFAPYAKQHQPLYRIDVPDRGAAVPGRAAARAALGRRAAVHRPARLADRGRRRPLRRVGAPGGLRRRRPGDRSASPENERYSQPTPSPLLLTHW